MSSQEKHPQAYTFTDLLSRHRHPDWGNSVYFFRSHLKDLWPISYVPRIHDTRMSSYCIFNWIGLIPTVGKWSVLTLAYWSQSRRKRNWEYLNHPSSVNQSVSHTFVIHSHSACSVSAITWGVFNAGPPNLVKRCPSIISRSGLKMGYVDLFLDLKK